MILTHMLQSVHFDSLHRFLDFGHFGLDCHRLIADMISRSASNTNSNLRRAKSTNSIQRRPSCTSLVDPVAAQKYALVAATVAYERAHGKENDTQPEQQPSQLRRRRSNRAGGFEGEGSHFHETKPPRRHSSKRLSNTSDPPNHNPRSRRGTVNSNVKEYDFAAERPAPNRMHSVHTIHEDEKFRQHRSSISVHKLRKARSMYSSSSHVPGSSIDDISFDPTLDIPTLPASTPMVHTVVTDSELDMENTVDITTSLPAPLTRVNLENVSEHRAAFIGPPARDLHSHSVRYCASMMLTPFKKRKSPLVSSISPPESAPDVPTSYASVARLPVPFAATTPRFQRKRAISDVAKIGTITAKIRSVFRKTSNPLQELPVQQVNASRAYFGSDSVVESSSTARMGTNYQHAVENVATSTLALQPSVVTAREVSPSHSVMSVGTKSRVTSWADSTVAGTIIEANEEEQLETIVEDSRAGPEVLRKDAKYSSLNLFRRMKRTSKADIRSSEHVEQRSDASGSRQSRRSKSRASRNASRKSSGARENLPSQIRKTAALTKSSIRAVSPQLDIEQTDISNLGARISASTTPDPCSSDRSAQSTHRTRNRLQKARALRTAAPPPTTKQIAERIKRSDERWQEPLDGDRSLFYPHSPKRAPPDRHSRQASERADKGAETAQSLDDVFGLSQPFRDADVISPSIYSDDENCQNLDKIHELSAMPPTPLQQEPGTALVHTSHHVAKYSVGSPKRVELGQQRRTSKEWRNWLQLEVQDLGTPPPDDLRLSTDFVEHNPDSGHHRERTQACDDTGDEETQSSSEDNTRGDTMPQQNFVPSMAWRPKQPPRIIQHASDSSIPSTTTSAQSQLQTYSLLKESDDDDASAGLIQTSNLKSNASKARKSSYRYGVEDRPSSRLQGIEEVASVTNRPSSRMNDRFPYIHTSRPQSRTSGRSSTPAQSLHSRSSRPTMINRIQSASEKNKENNAPSPTPSIPMQPKRPRPLIRRPVSTATLGQSHSSLANYAMSDHRASPAVSLPPTPQQSLLPRPVHSSPQRPILTAGRSENSDMAIRRMKHISMPSLETDPTLANIVQGPYRGNASPRPLSIRKSSSYRREGSPLKENSAPSTPKAEAPATPTSGQRLAEQFLNARRFREELKAISPAEGGLMSTIDSSEFSPAFL